VCPNLETQTNGGIRAFIILTHNFDKLFCIYICW